VENRIERIESKIDDLQEAVVSLARVEERLVTVFNRQSGIEEKVNTLDIKVDALSKNMASTVITERIIWIVIATVIGAAFNFMG
tara:strand:+ start:497 stop:748 length:252 start_codon:yes stop_codon:yes gene_type:complete